MKKIVLTIVAVFMAVTIYAQDPIFDPSMSIVSIGIVSSPIGEEVDKIIDGDIMTKFLDFELDDGMGFDVDLGGLSLVATSLEMTTANDFEERDPTEFEVLGSNDGVSYISIASGAIACVPDRLFARTFDFVNTTAYSYYRIDYTLACDPTGGMGIASLQVAETQLYQPVLGLSDNFLSEAISVFPNPSQGEFNLTYTGNESLINAEVVDIAGKIIQKFDLKFFDNIQQFKLRSVASGVYFLRIQSESAIAVKRIIIK